MTYNVFGETLSLTQSINQSINHILYTQYVPSAALSLPLSRSCSTVDSSRSELRRLISVRAASSSDCIS